MAEGGGLLNRYRAKSPIGGSNPPLSASFLSGFFSNVNQGFYFIAAIFKVTIDGIPALNDWK